MQISYRVVILNTQFLSFNQHLTTISSSCLTFRIFFSEPISIISSYHEEEKGGEEKEEVEEEEISGVLSLQAIVYILSVMAILGLTLATLVLCKGAIKRAIYELMLKIKHPRAVRRVPVLENCEEKSVENAECELTPLSTVSNEGREHRN